MELDVVFNKTLLIDGSYFLHRMLAQPNQWDLQTTYGKRTGGIFGVIKSVFKEMQKYNYFPIVIFDGGLAPRRLEAYSNYKRNEEKQLLLESTSYEEKTEQQLLDEAFMREYRTQRKDIIEILQNFGIPCIRIEDWEGDDLLYILSKMSKDSIIITDDRDLIQSVYEDDNRRCRIWRTMHNEMWDVNTLKEQGLDAWQYICNKAIVGDPSDNIPSACYGVGEKTAGGLMKLYESCYNANIKFPTTEEELDNTCKKLNVPKRKAYINFNEEQFNTNMDLMDLQLVLDDITPDFINLLYDEIIMETKMMDEYLVAEKLKNLEIYSINIGGIFNRVDKVIDFLRIEDIDKVSNKPDEVITTLF